MDLASGYSDSINYGNGYTPLATGAINNNNAEYLRNQMAMAMMAQAYNPYANSGGSFGAQPAAYAGIGADYGRAVGGGGNIYAPQQSVFDTGAAPYNSYYSSPAGQAFLSSYGQGGIGSDAVGAPNQPAITPQQTYVGGFNPYDPSSFARSTQQNVGGGYGGGAAAGLPGLADTRTPQQTDYSQIPSGIFTGDFRSQPQQYSGGGIGGESVRDPYQDWLQNSAASQGYKTYGGGLPPFWQGVRDMTGMGQPGGGGYDPYAGFGNQGQQGVVDPMGYGSGGYQGNAIPTQQPQPQPQPQQQPNNLPWFWQSIRDMAGADPKDQSRVPQSDGGYPGMTNPNYQPGGMAPQKPYESWLNAS